MIDDELPPEAEDHLFVFRKSLPLQVKLQEVRKTLGKAEGLSCLEIGFDNVVASYLLRKGGGKWETVVVNPDLEEVATAVLGEGTRVQEGNSLPFRKMTFDVVVAVNVLEKVESDSELIEECHRVLKPNGRLIAVVPHAKIWSLVNVFRGLIGATFERLGCVRPGYTEQQLFRALKHGFDVMHVRSFLRFFVEIVNVFVSSAIHSQPQDDTTVAHQKEVHKWAAPLWRIAYQLDLLLLLTRGFTFVVTCKRHIWLPRSAPVLADGRSIGEAVLSKAGGRIG